MIAFAVCVKIPSLLLVVGRYFDLSGEEEDFDNDGDVYKNYYYYDYY